MPYFLFLILTLCFSLCVPAQAKKTPVLLTPFIPNGYALLDTATADLNADGLQDVVLILKNKKEDDSTEMPRPLLLLLGSAKGLQLHARNDSVVLCKGCGGVFGDPYEGISVNGRYFSIDHYGGSAWRWTRNITFRFDAKTKTFLLHKDGGVSFHATDPNKTEENWHHKENFGKQKFVDYRNSWLE